MPRMGRRCVGVVSKMNKPHLPNVPPSKRYNFEVLYSDGDRRDHVLSQATYVSSDKLLSGSGHAAGNFDAETFGAWVMVKPKEVERCGTKKEGAAAGRP